MFRLVGSDVGNSSEDVTGVGGSPFNTVSMIDAAFSSLGIDIKPLKVVVEIHGSGTEISSQQGCMSSEDGGHIDLAPLGQW